MDWTLQGFLLFKPLATINIILFISHCILLMENVGGKAVFKALTPSLLRMIFMLERNLMISAFFFLALPPLGLLAWIRGCRNWPLYCNVITDWFSSAISYSSVMIISGSCQDFLECSVLALYWSHKPLKKVPCILLCTNL